MNLLVRVDVVFYKAFTSPLDASSETVVYKAGDVLLGVHESYRALINDNAEVFEVYDS